MEKEDRADIPPLLRLLTLTASRSALRADEGDQGYLEDVSSSSLPSINVAPGGRLGVKRVGERKERNTRAHHRLPSSLLRLSPPSPDDLEAEKARLDAIDPLAFKENKE